MKATATGQPKLPQGMSDGVGLVGQVLCRSQPSSARKRLRGLMMQVTNRMFLAEWLISVPACMGACAVFALNHEFLAVRREIKNGAYSPWAYLISNAIFQVRRRETHREDVRECIILIRFQDVRACEILSHFTLSHKHKHTHALLT
jgi:hypothetical protein